MYSSVVHCLIFQSSMALGAGVMKAPLEQKEAGMVCFAGSSLENG